MNDKEQEEEFKTCDKCNKKVYEDGDIYECEELYFECTWVKTCHGELDEPWHVVLRRAQDDMLHYFTCNSMISGGAKRRARAFVSPAPRVMARVESASTEKIPWSNEGPNVVGSGGIGPIHGSRICPPCVWPATMRWAAWLCGWKLLLHSLHVQKNGSFAKRVGSYP